ncbi:MAG TPA: alpha-amylase family protein [Stellaceae bacterium]|nr:alpha-amylase family protein [Stellaceae bacterium]
MGLLTVLTATTSPAAADRLVVSERAGIIEAIYQLAQPKTGWATLSADWTDSLGRLVDHSVWRVKLNQRSLIKWPLDKRRAVTERNFLRVRLFFDRAGARGAKIRAAREERTSFTIIPLRDPWTDYQLIMWHARTARSYEVLREHGFTSGKIYGVSRSGGAPSDTEAAALLDSNLRWYVENIATDFYSAYHRWTPGRPKNWLFLAAKQLYKEKPNSSAAFIRQPSLADPLWLREISRRLHRVVTSQRAFHPLYYSLGDETGIADLTAFWDFDLSGYSLQDMRSWLRQRYGSLRSLNAEWGSHFRHWQAVTPMMTSEAFLRVDENFAAWSDFKEWMDVAFSRALRIGTDAIHRADPNALSAIEGAQIPGWGGYDYSRLAGAVDLMELDDLDGSVEVSQLQNPKIVLISTLFQGAPEQGRAIWRELLRGFRGVIIWDPKQEFIDDDGRLGKWGRTTLPDLEEIRRGVGALLINSRRKPDGVAILYSQASMRIGWLLDRRSEGVSWIDRDAESETKDNSIRSAIRHDVRLAHGAGFQPRFLPASSIARGALRSGQYSILFLPHAIALARNEGDEIRHFAERGGTVVADVRPGIFDEHGRKYQHPPLGDLFGKGASAAPIRTRLGHGRAILLGANSSDAVQGLAAEEQLVFGDRSRPIFPVTDPSGSPLRGIEFYRYRNGRVTLLALQRNDSRQAADLSETVSSESSTVEKAILHLPSTAFAYDIRTGEALGRGEQVDLRLDPSRPTLLAVSPARLSAPCLSVPHKAIVGDLVPIRIELRDRLAEARVVHLDVIDPRGRIVSIPATSWGTAGRSRAGCLSRLTRCLELGPSWSAMSCLGRSPRRVSS